MKKSHNIFLLLVLFLVSCQNFTASYYDTQVDCITTRTQQRIDLLFEKVSDNLHTKKVNYRYYQADYEIINSQLHVLLTRSQTVANNQTTTQQVIVLINSIQLLERRHKQGFTNRKELQQLQKLIDDQFGAILTVELAKSKTNDSREGTCAI